MDNLLILKLILLPLATWRLYRLFATDTGWHRIFRRIRIKLGVHYAWHEDGTPDYEHWTTPDGSIAEGLTCCWCASLWWGGLLTLLILFAPSLIYLLIVLPLNAGVACLFYENKIYSKGDK